jgi:hypothetical protein
VARALDPAAGERLARWRAWALPGGEGSARAIEAVEWEEEGELRSSPRARWIPFRARHRLEAARTTFRWDAMLGTGALTRTAVTDACDDGRGWSVAKAAGILPVARVTGPEMDRGQVMRWLADVARCPSALILHPGLEASATGEDGLLLRDAAGPADAVVEVRLAPDGAPVAIRGMRPGMEGRRFVVRPWSGTMGSPLEWEGLRVPTRLEAAWEYPEGVVVTYRASSKPIRAVRHPV